VTVQRQFLPGGRLHLNHGPIDLIIEAFGPVAEVQSAYAQAWVRFPDILPKLVEELPLLRQAIGPAPPALGGPVAQRMAAAVWPHRQRFITPMAAVAGAVADEMLAALLAGRSLSKAYVNNGGDIAFYLAPGETLAAGLVGNADCPSLDGVATISTAMPVRGIATSGWRGRSFSLGIADAATVLANDAAAADAAATLVANAIDLDHASIKRARACDLDEASDLGARLVTTEVGWLEPNHVEQALCSGVACAEAMRRAGLIHGAVLVLQHQIRVVGDVVPRLLSAA
jgi:ApbE superfamily uncharacterized protein (UPF0280 family)